jgi:N-dimethylarginine dimethylaminohydrolase
MLNINTTVLMSDAKHFCTEQPINPYYHPVAVDYDKAIHEHKIIHDLLVQAGIKVIKVPSPTNCQDGVYAANWAVVRGDKAVLARLPNARHDEEAYAEKVLTYLGKKVYHLPAGLKFSGQGDCLACGELLFCGSGYRSDVAAQTFVAKKLGYKRIQLKAVPQLDSTGKPTINTSSGWPDSFFYDLDLAIAIIKAPIDNQKGLIAYCPDAFTPKSRQLLEKLDEVDKIEVSIKEAEQGFATNLVSTGETVVMSAHAPKLTKELRRRGLAVLTADITELSKGGGFIRCITLTID